MSLFESLKEAIFRHAEAPQSAAAKPASPAAPVTASTGGPPTQKTVDIEKTLEGLNARLSQRLNWRTSIVDLMKLVGMDPSLQHRQQMAQELGYKGSTADTAAMNMWLHQEVMAKLAREGVQVPSSSQQRAS